MPPRPPTRSAETRAAQLLRGRGVWDLPLAAGSLLVVLMTAFYFGALVDPTANLHGLPVALVNRDVGATTPSGTLELGRKVSSALTGTRAVTKRLAISTVKLEHAKAEMNRGAAYVTVVIPPDFTASVLALLNAPRTSATALPPTIELLDNDREGTLGVSLGNGVLQPALAAVSRAIGRHLAPETEPGSLERRLLADPVSVSLESYRPLPSHSAVGLSAFYISLLIMMAGFLGAILIHTSVDTVLGYASSELGPWWRQKSPQRIGRWQTLITEWAVALPVTLVLSGLLLAVAVGLLKMDAPHWFELWMYGWFAALTVAAGTLVLFAALGALGQLLALLAFVYLGLASSGGTVQVQALNGLFQFFASFEPLRQIVGAVLAILYFNAAGDAGLDRGLVLTAIGLVFWIVIGAAVTNRYDKRGLERFPTESGT